MVRIYLYPQPCVNNTVCAVSFKMFTKIWVFEHSLATFLLTLLLIKKCIFSLTILVTRWIRFRSFVTDCGVFLTGQKHPLFSLTVNCANFVISHKKTCFNAEVVVSILCYEKQWFMLLAVRISSYELESVYSYASLVLSKLLVCIHN